MPIDVIICCVLHFTSSKKSETRNVGARCWCVCLPSCPTNPTCCCNQVLDTFTRDITRLLTPLTATNQQAATTIQKVLSAAASQGQTLKQDVQGGVKTAAEAADELLGIVKAAIYDLRSLLLSSSAAEASATAAGVAAEAAAAIADAISKDRPAGVLLQAGQVQVGSSSASTGYAEGV